MTTHAKLAATIDAAFEERAKFSPANAPAEVTAAVEAAIDLLDRGEERVAEKVGGEWWSTSGSRRRCCSRSGSMTTKSSTPS